MVHRTRLQKTRYYVATANNLCGTLLPKRYNSQLKYECSVNPIIIILHSVNLLIDSAFN